MLMRWTLITVAATLAVVVAGASPAVVRLTSIDLVKALEGKTVEQDQGALDELLIRQRAFTAAVLAEMRSPTLGTRAEAIYLLGAYGISEGVPVLLANLDFKFYPPFSTIIILAPSPPYPAVWALIDIGMPSVHAILKALPTEANAERRKLMVQVLVGVEGADVTRFRLKQAIAQATIKSEKANLTAALADLNPPVPKAPGPVGGPGPGRLDP